MPEEPLTGRDRRTAVLALVSTVVLVAAATWFVVLRPPGPSVPHGRGHLSLTPATAHAGDELHAHADDPLDRGATDTMLVDRWDGHHWVDTRQLVNGAWSSPNGDGAETLYYVEGGPTTNWSFTLPVGMPPGPYLVCDADDDCGLLDVD